MERYEYASFIEVLEKYVDEPVIGENTYEDNKGLITAIWGAAALAVVGVIAVAACVATGGLAAGLAVVATAAVGQILHLALELDLLQDG